MYHTTSKIESALYLIMHSHKSQTATDLKYKKQNKMSQELQIKYNLHFTTYLYLKHNFKKIP
jgi:hypothetical protein